jgi:pimeloyl-ACP methyl ester carboxylesterase
MGWVPLIALVVALLLLAGFSYQQMGAMRGRRDFPPPGTLVNVGSHQLHLRCSGQGIPAVVFEAGIAASSLSWSRVQPRVATFTRACSYDRAGLAWSQPTWRPRAISSLVSELADLLSNAEVPPPYVLVGHSFGGIIIRAFAREHPAKVAALVFVDTLHPAEWCYPSRRQRQLLRGGIFLSRVGGVLASVGVVRASLTMLSGGAPGAAQRFSRVFGPTTAAFLEHIVGEVQKLPPDVLPSVQAHWSNRKAFVGMRRQLSMLPVCSAEVSEGRDAFGDIPLVVLSGGRKDPRWLEADAELARESSRGRHLVSTRSGHWIHLDDPDLVVEVVREIVESARHKV